MTGVGRALAILALLVGISAGCTQPDCIMPPCPMPIAIRVTVTSAAGGPVPGLTMTVSGSVSSSGPCATGESASSCFEPGVPGTYNLRLTAPGFQDATLRVVVPGTTPECGCPTVQTQQVSVVLTPS
jgi:hypothetical protein